MPDAIICSYSRAITDWLTKRFPDSVSLDSSCADHEEIISVFQLLLPSIEFQATTQGHYSLSRRIEQLSGLTSKKEQLMWLLRLFSQSHLPETVKDELYGQLKVFVQWNKDDSTMDGSTLNFPVTRSWKGRKIIRTVRAGSVVRKKLGPPVKLSFEERTSLMDTIKCSLALHYRETDPVTFADADEIELFDMGRGLHIAIVGLQKQRRLSLESYIGYMAFKNRLPMAYGGGWIWGQQCRVGISIYPDFRKGESAWTFGQVLRLYYQYFHARHFIIRANQFGKGNHDGLKTGAFWFYYKLGFRPCDKELRKLAREEFKRIRASKIYRSSLKTLRMFLTAPLEWRPSKTAPPVADAELISRKISDVINTKYDCSRTRAIRSVKTQLNRKLKPLSLPNKPGTGDQNLENWSLLINLLTDFPEWEKMDKKKLLDLIRIKQTGKERDHIIGMQNLPVFWQSLKRI